MGVFRRLLRVSQRFRLTFAVALVLLLITSVLETAVLPVLFTCLLFLVLGTEAFTARGFSLKIGDYDFGKPLGDVLDSNEPLPLLIQVSLLIVVAVLLKCAAQARQSYLMNKFAHRTAMVLRQRIFDRLVTLSPAQFDKTTKGDLLSRMTNDVAILQDSLGLPLSGILQAPISVTIALGIMLAISWKLTLVALCLAPVIAVLIAAMGRVVRKLIIRSQDRMGALHARLSQILAGIRVIQSFTMEPFERKRVDQLNRQYYNDSMKSVLVTETLSPAIEAIAVVGILLGVVVGGFAVLRQSMPPESFVLFVLMAQQAGNKFTRLARMNTLRQRVSGVGERIFALLDIEPAIQDASGAKTLPKVNGRVVFDHVCFHYDGGPDVLSDIDFTVPPGEMTALVGPSGGGKTTLINLLLRFYDPTRGRILIDDHDIRDVTLVSLRMQIGIVAQETTLFHGTIEENIRYGRPGGTEKEVEAAARLANVTEFTGSMPAGLGSDIGEGGNRLSAGQRQRVAIARALLKNPRLLILDEATSAQDAESELLVQQALGRLMEGRTTIVIAHRLNTVQHAQRILVLSRGRIVETGRHKELLAKGGLYRRLYRMQLRDEEPDLHTPAAPPEKEAKLR